ncbi:MAG: hypothetical protein LBE71_01635, partial [Dysgonamonadaceae bacterium]|nr:hypothetical protein [Dysgonamonadaceae bacterium]
MPFDFSKIKIIEDTANNNSAVKEDIESKVRRIYGGENPSSGGTAGTPTEQDTGFWHTWLGDAVQKAAAGGDRLLSGTLKNIN